MPTGNVNVLDLKTRGQCSVTEKGGEIMLKAGDPLSALQSVARQASLQISLTPEEMARFVAAGRLEISLHYANNSAGATGAAKRIDQMVTEAALASRGRADKQRSFWKKLGLLLLLLAAGAAIFAGTVAALDWVYASHLLPQFLR